MQQQRRGGGREGGGELLRGDDLPGAGQARLPPVRSYPLVPVIDNYPIVMAAENKMAVLDKILSGVKQTIMKDLMTTMAAENVAVEIPSKAEQEAGKLANA